jgi:hypothetical protein
MKYLVLALLVISSFQLNAQLLSLEEIMNIRAMDSIQLKAFCVDNNFQLKEEYEDNWIYSQSYYSQNDGSIWFIKTYPKDKKTDGIIYFYFQGEQNYDEFKKQIKENQHKHFWWSEH